MESNSTKVIDPCLDGVNDPEFIYWTNVQWYFKMSQPLIYLIGFLGNIVSILAFRKQAKISESFYQQLNIMVIDLVSVCFYSVAELSYLFANVWANNSQLAAQKNFFLVVLFVHSYTFAFWSTSTSVVLINGACIERLYALYRPLKYSALNQKRVASYLLCLALLVGFLTNAQTFYAHYISWNPADEIYIVTVPTEALENPVVRFMTQLQTTVHVAGLCTLTIFIVLIIMKYEKVMKQRAQHGNQTGDRPVTEATLTKLLLAQCALNYTGLLGLTVSNFMIKVLIIPWCSSHIVISDTVSYFLLSLQHSLNFLIYAGISKKFRHAFVAVVRCRELPVTNLSRRVNERVLQAW